MNVIHSMNMCLSHRIRFFVTGSFAWNASEFAAYSHLTLNLLATREITHTHFTLNHRIK